FGPTARPADQFPCRCPALPRAISVAGVQFQLPRCWLPSVAKHSGVPLAQSKKSAPAPQAPAVYSRQRLQFETEYPRTARNRFAHRKAPFPGSRLVTPEIEGLAALHVPG